MQIIPIDDHITAIDHLLLDRPGVGVCYLVRGDDLALIETGTSLTVPHTLAALAQLGVAPEAVSHILCTHIHMDHSGGAGDLAVALPRAHVYIHSMVAEHLVEPSRLMASVRRAVGEESWPLHGVCRPIDPDRLKPAENLRLDLGRDVIIEAIATPGHSPDHLSYRDWRSGGLFIGDAAGIVMERYGLAFPVTPPPTYNLAQHQQTISELLALDLPRIYLTHYGAHDAVATHLGAAAERLAALVDLVERELAAGNQLVSDALTEAWLGPQSDPDAAFLSRAWGEMSINGLGRYLQKHRGSA